MEVNQMMFFNQYDPNESNNDPDEFSDIQNGDDYITKGGDSADSETRGK